MFAARNLHWRSFKSLSSLLHHRPSKSVSISRDYSPRISSSNVVQLNKPIENEGSSFSSPAMLDPFSRGRRSMSFSTPKGRSMRSKVEKRMQKETGKTMREVRRAKKIQKKLMTENERLVYNLKRAKRKVAVLLQKLKKYELPELPPPRHDPEILTPEQLQAFKKIGFKNKNYVTVGVRGVFGGVVQNLHMHWKFHETVQVCCDNFPKEKIKEMAMMLARLSGGIVINIHNVKTIIMYRGRNYRQPKNLIPINTLTKRKALFKARFEQALESQKLNIKKIEQQLRRSGINPEDPVATASIQRVASSFFNAIDKKEGTPYVFREDKLSLTEPNSNFEPLEPTDEREQAELDKFIADIEDAAEREWAAEEAAEKEDFGRIRYWNKEEFSGRFRRSEMSRDDRSDDEIRGSRGWRDTRVKPRAYESDDEENDPSDADDDWRSHNAQDDSDAEDCDEDEKFEVSRRDTGKRENISRARNSEGYNRNASTNFRKSVVEEESEAFRHIDKAMWQSSDDDEHEHDSSSASRAMNPNYMSESDEEEGSYDLSRQKRGMIMYESSADDSDHSQSILHESRSQKGTKQNRNGGSANYADSFRNSRAKLGQKRAEEDFDSEDSCSDSESAWRDREGEGERQSSRVRNYDDSSSGDEYEKYQVGKDSKNGTTDTRRTRTKREGDEIWDSD